MARVLCGCVSRYTSFGAILASGGQSSSRSIRVSVLRRGGMPTVEGEPISVASVHAASNKPLDGESPAAAQGTEGSEPAVSKKAAQKAAKKAERAQNRQAALAAAAKEDEEDDPLTANYGDVKLEDLQSKEMSNRTWAKVSELGLDLVDKTVLVRGRAQSTRGKGKLAFLVVRESGYTVQCVATVKENVVSKQMVKYVSGLNKESVVDVEGVVSNPGIPISGTTQQVEIQVRKLYCVSKSQSQLPFTLEDASRSEQEIEKGEQEGLQYVRVLQDTRLNNRVLDLRTPANQAIFKIQSWVQWLFSDFLRGEGFYEIHTPKLIAGASEGGSAVFALDYMGQPACLAQSPQLHKQMAISSDFGRVYEIGPVFRAEKSFTHRHLCEFIGLDLEMEIKEHYNEVMDLVGKLFVYMFNGLNEKCKTELEAVNQQYPFEPLKYLEETLKLTFSEGIELLEKDGLKVNPFEDLNTETERRLGRIVKEKYHTDFYILHRYPLAVRPFYTMPAVDDPRYSNSFDVFIRGEEIISGAQRVHDVELLIKRAQECNIDLKSLATYIDSFRMGTVPHGGAGVGLERVVMLFCGLNNIRKTSMFPRDPQRIAP